jgi:hypothetical protein
MAVRKLFACVSLVALAIASQPAFAENGNDPPTTNPSATPAKRHHRHHHTGKHRHHQKLQQQQGPQTGTN